jgi:DNA-binding MarR family transcriptional regulator
VTAAPAEVTALALLLGRLERLNESLVAEICGLHGVSPAELRVLALLRHGRVGPEGVRPTEISTWVVQTSGGLTATLGRLEHHGRIERVDDPADGRGRLVVLTESGRAFYDRLLDDLTERYGVVLEAIDLDQALVTVRQLIDAFERSAGLTPTGDWSLVRQLGRRTA